MKKPIAECDGRVIRKVLRGELPQETTSVNSSDEFA
jgi:hypothetical protein